MHLDMSDNRMTPRKLAMVADFATAVARANERCRTDYAQHDPDEYPFLVFADPPDTRDVPVEEYPPEPDPFERDEFWWRRK